MKGFVSSQMKVEDEPSQSNRAGTDDRNINQDILDIQIKEAMMGRTRAAH